MFSLGLIQWPSQYLQFLAVMQLRDMFLLSGESEASLLGSTASKNSLGQEMSDIKATKQNQNTTNECPPYLHIDSVVTLKIQWPYNTRLLVIVEGGSSVFSVKSSWYQK